MDPIVNIEGAPGRIVGKRKPQKDCLKGGMEMQAVLRQLRAPLRFQGFPKESIASKLTLTNG